MALASVLVNYEDELRADLQQCYGIDLDKAAGGEHSARHVAALAVQLPRKSRLARRVDKDNEWTLDGVLLALIVNDFRRFVYGMSDPKKRGKAPELIGPAWLVKKSMKSIPTRVLPIEKLMEELDKPRRV